MFGNAHFVAAADALAKDQDEHPGETNADWLTRHGVDPDAYANAMTAVLLALSLEGRTGALAILQHGFELGFTLGQVAVEQEAATAA